MQEPAREGERDREREGAPDQRAKAAEEERVRTADVVVELELARVDPLDDADDRADRPRDQRRDAAHPAEGERDAGNRGDDRCDRGHPGEVDDLGLPVGGLPVVGLGLVERLGLALQNRSVLVVGVGAALVDEAEEMGGGGGDELEADALAHAGEHGARADGELVAAVQLGRDLVAPLRRPVALAVEAPLRALPREPRRLLGQRDGALEMGAPEGVHELAVRSARSGRAARGRRLPRRPARRSAAPATTRSARRRAP